MGRREHSGGYGPERRGKFSNQVSNWLREQTEREKSDDIVSIAQKLAPEKNFGNYAQAEEFLLDQHDVVAPKTEGMSRVGLLAFAGWASIDFPLALEERNYILALDVSNKFAGYVRADSTLQAQYTRTLISQNSILLFVSEAIFNGESPRSTAAHDVAKEYNRSGDFATEAVQLREAVHWAVLDGLFGEKGKELFDPLALTQVSRWLIPKV